MKLYVLTNNPMPKSCGTAKEEGLARYAKTRPLKVAVIAMVRSLV